MIRTRILPGVVLLLLAHSSIGFGAEPPPPSRAKVADPMADFVIGAPVVYRNLTIFPVSSKTAKNQDRFITLDEALKQGSVQIQEKGATNNASQRANSPSRVSQSAGDDPFGSGNDVNEVVVINSSSKPLYLMPGEIIIGGSQDRTIGQELVIAPDKKPVKIEVFCVEHGRWGARAEADYDSILAEATTSASRAGAGDTAGNGRAQARAANGGKFVGSVGSLNGPARIAVQKGDGQEKVWDEVSSANAKSGVKSKSGAFTGNYAESKVVKQLRPYTDHFVQPVVKAENVVGAIVAVNGKVESMDIFESTPLFKKLWPKLLKSYALDALNAADEKLSPKQCSSAEALAFLQETARAGTKKSDTKKGITSTQQESDKVLLFSAHELSERRSAEASAARGGGLGGGGIGGGGFGGAIHSSGFAK
jgi:hypothetical protein